MEKQPVLNLIKEIDYSANGIVSKQILKHKNGNVTLFSFDENQALSAHTSPFEALISVQEGKAIISIAENEYQLQAGDSIVLPATIPHAVTALTRFKMLLTMIRPGD